MYKRICKKIIVSKEFELKREDGGKYNRSAYVILSKKNIFLRTNQKIVCDINKLTKDALVYGKDHCHVTKDQIKTFLKQYSAKSVRYMLHSGKKSFYAIS